MRIPRCCDLRRTLVIMLGLLLLLAVQGPHAAVQAQFMGNAAQGLVTAQGEWLQVLTVTDRWLVLENERGQQFPVSADAVGTFAMRWPTNLERLDENCLVEVTGLDLGSNRVAADHADVYRGPARNLVTPTIQHLFGFNRVLTLLDMQRQSLLGVNPYNFMSPQEMQMPRRIHAVAPPINLNPLQLGAGGNNFVTVIAAPAGMSMTEVTTANSFRFVRPGDLAYVVSIPQSPTPRTVVLSLLMILKDVPLEQFAP